MPTDDEPGQGSFSPGPTPHGPDRGIPPNAPWGALPDMAMFVATAVGSGIIGNAAYDALKASVAQLVRRRRLTRRPVRSHERDLIAWLAVRARCAEVGLPIPPVALPADMHWTSARDGNVCTVVHGDLTAKVLIPPGKLDGRQLPVTLVTHGPR